MSVTQLHHTLLCPEESDTIGPLSLCAWRGRCRGLRDLDEKPSEPLGIHTRERSAAPISAVSSMQLGMELMATRGTQTQPGLAT